MYQWKEKVLSFPVEGTGVVLLDMDKLQRKPHNTKLKKKQKILKKNKETKESDCVGNRETGASTLLLVSVRFGALWSNLIGWVILSDKLGDWLISFVSTSLSLWDVESLMTKL